KAKELNLPGMPVVAESAQIARDLVLAQATGVHYHVCHVSTKESVRLIRDAKKAGISVTAEVTPHHLLLTDSDIPEDSGLWKMNPPLRSKADQEALIAALLDGTIDCIATDHAPHTLAEKQQSFIKAPFGIVGVEFAFQLLYTHYVKPGIFTLEQLISWLSLNPAKIFGLNAGNLEEGAVADIAVFDLDNEYTLKAADLLSKGKNTPFLEEKLWAETMFTWVAGKLVWQKDEVK
ncbi:MAG: dihydroorotase, partial [Micrococcaceae bacterium]